MADRIPSPGVAEVTLNFTQDGQRVQNVYHFKAADGTWDVAGLHQLAGTFKNWWNSEMRPAASNTLTLRSIIVEDLSAGGQAIEHVDGLPSTGTNTNAPAPNNVTFSVKWGTGLRGRSFRGRTYHLGIVSNDYSGNTISPGSLSAYLGKYNALRITLDNFSLAGDFCVLSETEDKAPRAAGICTPITGCSIDPTLDSMRRRLPGRGR
jgi:hypothetical protein